MLILYNFVQTKKKYVSIKKKTSNSEYKCSIKLKGIIIHKTKVVIKIQSFFNVKIIKYNTSIRLK